MDAKGIIVAICAVIVALTSVAGLMAIVDDAHVPVDDTIRKTASGWHGGGQYPDPASDARRHGEIFDSTMYFTSWSATGNSEKIIVAGKMSHTADWLRCAVDKVGYWFFIHDGVNDDDVSVDDDDCWDTLVIDQLPDGTWVSDIRRIGAYLDNPNPLNAKMFNFQLDGLYADGATIMVRFRMHCSGDIWHTMSIDEARLIQGDGDLTWAADVYTVGVDTHAKLNWFVPAVDSEVEDRRAYTIFVTNENTGSIVYEQVVESKSGSISIPLTEDMAEMYGINMLKARLWNNIFQKDVTHVRVQIDGGFRAVGDEDIEFVFPVINSVTTDKPEYLEGETVTLTIDATAGTYPIDRYYILCEIEGTAIVDTHTSTTTYAFQASLAGIVECEVSCSDIYGNPSAKKTIKVTSENAILDDFCDSHPDDPACKDDDDEPMLDLLEVLIITLLFIALAAIVFLEFWALSQVGLTDPKILLVIIGMTLLIGLILIAMKIEEYAMT